MEIRDLGHLEYLAAWREMKSLHADRVAGRIPDTLILVEHPPVLTVGVQGSEGDVLPAHLPVHTVERGGKTTYHGPGQIVAYPIVDLNARGRDVRRFVHQVEEMAVLALRPYGVAASRVEGRRGVWVDGARKIASVGVAIEGWVSYHGLALNVSTDLSVFQAFHPCGLDGSLMTSLEREIGRPVPLPDVAAHLKGAFVELFDVPANGSPALSSAGVRAPA